MTHKSSYEELERRIQELEEEMLTRARAEEALRESEARHRSLVETSSDWLWEIDTNGRYTYVNARAQEILGYGPEKVVGRTPFDFMPEEESRRVRAIFAQIIAERRSFSLLENENLHRDGRRVVLETSGVPVFGPDGEFAGYRGVDRDITERKRAEDALRESQQMLHSVLDTIPVRVFWKDLDLNYLGCNRPFALDAGLQSPREIVGRNDFEMSWGEQARLYRSDDSQVIETGRPKLGYEEPQTTPSGDRIWLRTSKVPLFDVKGEAKGVLGTYEDITVYKRAEEALQKAHHELERRVEERTAELEKASQELWQIPSKLIAVQEEERKRLASELHDSIGQTLAAIKFWVEMALKLRNSGDDSTAFNHLEQFIPILQRSIEETRNIYMGLRPSMLDSRGLLATLEWLRQECMKLYPGRHIELDHGIAEEAIPKNLKVNIFRIAQEALNNIAKHSKAEWVDISLSKNGDGIELIVSDDGVGMDLDLVMQTSAARSLGLTIMRERTELTGGSFSIESIPGEGTTIRAFWIIEPEDQHF